LYKKIDKTHALLQSIITSLNKKKFELDLKNKQQVAQAISKLEIVKLNYDAAIPGNKK
jgi:hypothetical protein